jgi:hypothetical protein
MERLTGFRFSALETPGTMMIDCSIGDPGSGEPTRFGVDELHHPRFAVRGDGYEPLGEWSDGQGVAFARTSYEGHTSVYVGTAPVPARVLRVLAQDAGVRLWSSTTDIIRATHDAAALVATTTGARTLTLPHAMAPVKGGIASARHELTMNLGDVEIFVA